MKQKKEVGRPPVKELERKQTFTVSCSMKRRNELVKKYGTLTKALGALVV